MRSWAKSTSFAATISCSTRPQRPMYEVTLSRLKLRQKLLQKRCSIAVGVSNRETCSISPRSLSILGPTTCYRPSSNARLTNRSEEHTSELQSLMRISYAVFCLKKKTKRQEPTEKVQQRNR